MIVLDSSALLAYLLAEPGGERVRGELVDGECVCSAAIWSEVAQKVRFHRVHWETSWQLLVSFGTKVEAVTVEDAEAAALMWRTGDALSLADRLCLALASRLGATVLTADKAWVGRDRVVVIR